MTTPLPPYISWIGHGAAELASPATFTGAKAYLFAVEGDRAAMQATVDTLLDAAAPVGLRHEVPVSLFLVSFMDIERCTSAVPPPVGWLPGREVAVWVPLLQHRDGHLPRPVLWAPYIFINYTIGMVTGRETWGWPKVLGNIEMPSDNPGANASFTCRTTIFSTLSQATEGQKDAPLLRITGTGPLSAPGNVISNGESALEAIISRLFGEIAADLLDLLPWPVTFPTVVLKQIRDVAAQDRACYRAIVESPISFTSFDGMGFLDDDFTLSILTCESHRILHDFTGQAPTAPVTQLPVQHALWSALDFSALPGRVLD